MVKEFRAFLLRGNVVDLAVGIVIGAAFGAVVTALVADLITPIVAAIIGKPNFSGLYFTINGSRFLYGSFLNALISFVSIAAAVFFFVVKPVNALMARRRTEPDVDSETASCPECLSEIPRAARKCAFCGSGVQRAGRLREPARSVEGRFPDGPTASVTLFRVAAEGVEAAQRRRSTRRSTACRHGA
jgi:large conductance mechanosensitive channel